MRIWVSSLPAAATRMSRPIRAFRVLGRFLPLARLSLVAVGLSMLPGCLIDDPPPYTAPKPTPPRLDYTQALPSLDQVIVTNVGEVVNFKMPVTSEDAGQALFAILLFDYGGDGSVPDFLYSAPLPASTLDDPQPRVFSLPWTVRKGVPPGCHRVTLRVTHFANLDRNKPAEAVDKKDLAEAYWFANINVNSQMANSLVDCPQASVGGSL